MTDKLTKDENERELYPKVITLKMLKIGGACTDARIEFQRLFGDQAEFNLRNLKKIPRDSDLTWLNCEWLVTYLTDLENDPDFEQKLNENFDRPTDSFHADYYDTLIWWFSEEEPRRKKRAKDKRYRENKKLKASKQVTE